MIDRVSFEFANHCPTQTPAMSPVMFFPTAVSLGRHRVITWPEDGFFARTRPGIGIDFASTGCLGRERTSRRAAECREGRGDGSSECGGRKGPPLSGVPLLSHGFAAVPVSRENAAGDS